MEYKNTVEFSNKRTQRVSHSIVIAVLAFAGVFVFGISEAKAENSWHGGRNGYSYQTRNAPPPAVQRQINMLRRTLERNVARAESQIRVLTVQLHRAQQARRPNRRWIASINRRIQNQQRLIAVKQAQFQRSVNAILARSQRSVSQPNHNGRGNGNHSGQYGNRGQNNHNGNYGQNNHNGNYGQRW